MESARWTKPIEAILLVILQVELTILVQSRLQQMTESIVQKALYILGLQDLPKHGIMAEFCGDVSNSWLDLWWVDGSIHLVVTNRGEGNPFLRLWFLSPRCFLLSVFLFILSPPITQNYFYTPKLYDRKNALVAADLLNDEVVAFHEQHGIRLLRILTDRGSEYCGNREHHEYQLYLEIEDIDHSKTQARSPQTNGICERFHKTVLNEFYRIAFRKKVYESIESLQKDLHVWLKEYNEQRPHTGKYCFGKTPMQTWLDSVDLAEAKLLDLTQQTETTETQPCQIKS